MEHENSVVQPVVMEVHLPAGIAGPEPLDFDVRAFLLSHPEGVVLIDTGMPGSSDLIAQALVQIDASWGDITDIVLTHAHLDHIGGLDEVLQRADNPVIWVGDEDPAQIPQAAGVRNLAEGQQVRGLVALATPGHTPGHMSLFHPELSALFLGDLAGSEAGTVRPSPAAFTDDYELARVSLARVAALNAERVYFSHGAEVDNPFEALKSLLEDPLAGAS